MEATSRSHSHHTHVRTLTYVTSSLNKAQFDASLQEIGICRSVQPFFACLLVRIYFYFFKKVVFLVGDELACCETHLIFRSENFRSLLGKRTSSGINLDEDQHFFNAPVATGLAGMCGTAACN